jgi:hypothetical protein
MRTNIRTCDPAVRERERRASAAASLAATAMPATAAPVWWQPAGSARFTTHALAGIGRAIRALDRRGCGCQQTVAHKAVPRAGTGHELVHACEDVRLFRPSTR